MSGTDPYDRAKEVFVAALDQPASERDAFVDAACAGDDQLRDEVRALLEAEQENAADKDFLASPVAFPASDGSAPDLGERAGARVGRYELIKPLGEGGMGSVWLARQTGAISREVALKVIRLGMDTREIIARFEAERQTLARMEHPGIARVYDAGATSAGRPYFAMELVRGEPITLWCDERRAPIEERLRVFVLLCDAVQYAHRQGVIHRDLKPSNILIEERDGRAAPRVIDFGIAKAVSVEERDRTFATEAGRPIGTPEYMSPEQAGVGGASVDTRTDVYSLGVLLYELLTGALPHSPEALRTTDLMELQRVLGGREPPSPSTRVSRLGKAGTREAAQARRLAPDRLRRRLSGDLDWIVMKAIAREPAQRYQSAHELMLDVERFLRSEPVVARPPSVRYRAGRFVRRHRVGVAAGSVAVIALLIGAIGLGVGFVRATDERDRALAAELDARREAERAEQTARFLREMLAGAGPSVALGRDATVLTEILKQTRGRLSELDGQPRVKGAILHTIGQTYADLGESDLALEIAAVARQILESAPDVPLSDVLNARRIEARALAAAGRLEEAQSAVKKLREETLASLGPDHPLHEQLLSVAGTIARESGRLDEAAELFEQSARRLRERLGEEHPETLAVRFDHAAALARLGRFEAAEPVMRQILEIRERALGARHPLTLYSLNALATLHGNTGRYEEGLAFYLRVLELRREVLGPEHPATATSINNLAYVYANTDRLREAEQMFRDALEIYQRTEGETSANAMLAMNNLGAVMRLQERYDDAQRLLERAYELRRSELGDDHPSTLSSLHNVAALAKDRGDFARASSMAVGALDGRLRTLGPSHPRTLQSAELVVDAALSQEPPDQAAAEQAVERLASALETAPDDERRGRALETLERLRGRVETGDASIEEKM